MSDRQPHPNSTGWTMEIPEAELDRAMSMAAACRFMSERGQYFSVGVIDCTTRRWVFDDGAVVAWADAPCNPNDPHEPVRLPRHFVEAALHLAASLESVRIYQDRTTGQFVAVSGDDTVAADPWDGDSGELDDLESCSETFDADVSAVLSMETVRRIALDYGSFFEMAFGRTATVTPAFTGITVTEGRISWISDWTRWNLPKQSGSATAETKGSGSVGFLAEAMWRSARFVHRESTATITWNRDNPTCVWMIGDDWGVRCDVNHELTFRHQSNIHVGFALADYVEDVDTEFDASRVGLHGPRIHFNKNGRIVTVTVHDPGNDHPDYARIVTHVASADTDLPAVRAEIDRLNEALIAAKLLVRDNQIFVAVEFPLGADHKIFETQIACLEEAVSKCEGLDEFLPLFSQG